MVTTEWFWIKKDPDAPSISDAKGFNRKKYPYFTDEKSFVEVEDAVAYYEYGGKFVECDFLFEPTFLIHDNFHSLFRYLEPELQFKGVQLYATRNVDRNATPLYWLPYLPITDAVSDETKLIQGKPVKLILKYEPLAEKRVAHCKLPAADIWLVSLEAAECILRRQPIGIILEKIDLMFKGKVVSNQWSVVSNS
ncbi:MAG: hypothetical protein IKZ58_05350 [Selenomonadaceae bacterium]|nr:hypothetical protein [Selenomonadaceae bacterium]